VAGGEMSDHRGHSAFADQRRGVLYHCEC